MFNKYAGLFPVQINFIVPANGGPENVQVLVLPIALGLFVLYGLKGNKSFK